MNTEHIILREHHNIVRNLSYMYKTCKFVSICVSVGDPQLPEYPTEEEQIIYHYTKFLHDQLEKKRARNTYGYRLELGLLRVEDRIKRVAVHDTDACAIYLWHPTNYNLRIKWVREKTEQYLESLQQ